MGHQVLIRFVGLAKFAPCLALVLALETVPVLVWDLLSARVRAGQIRRVCDSPCTAALLQVASRTRKELLLSAPRWTALLDLLREALVGHAGELKLLVEFRVSHKRIALGRLWSQAAVCFARRRLVG